MRISVTLLHTLMYGVKKLRMKKVLGIFIMMFLGLVLSSCTGSFVSMCDLFPESQKVEVHQPAFDVDSIRKPIDMYYVDGKLFLVDMYSSPLVTAFDWKTGKYLGQFANRGQGPQEFLWFSTASSFDGKLGLYDVNKKEFAWFAYAGDTVRCSSIRFTHSDKMFPFKVIALSDEYFIATGLIEENKHFAIYNKEGQKVTVFGDYPKDDSKADCSYQENAFAYQPTGMVYHAKEKVFAVGERDGQIAIFFDMSDMLHPKLLKQHVVSYPQFTDNSTDTSTSVLFLKENVNGFFGMAATDKYCVGLFSGKQSPEGDTYIDGGDKLLLFDWKGNPIKRIDLPQEYSMITASEEQIVLLGTDPETYNYIINTIDICDL